MQKLTRQERRVAIAGLIAPGSAMVAIIIAVVEQVRHWELSDFTNAGAAVVEMVPAAALGVLLAALALLCLHPRFGPTARRFGAAAAAVTLALGLLTVSQFLVDWGASPPAKLLSISSWWLGRPGFVTGLAFALLGGALLVYNLAYRSARGGARMMAGLTLAVTFAEVVARVYGTTLVGGLHPWGGTAGPTATALTAIAFGLLFSDLSHGSAALYTSEGSGGAVLRRFAPVAVSAPLLLGLLSLAGENAGLVDDPFGTAMLVVALIVLLIGFILRHAAVLNATEMERIRLLAQERQAREQVTNIL